MPRRPGWRLAHAGHKVRRLPQGWRHDDWAGWASLATLRRVTRTAGVGRRPRRAPTPTQDTARPVRCPPTVRDWSTAPALHPARLPCIRDCCIPQLRSKPRRTMAATPYFRSASRRATKVAIWSRRTVLLGRTVGACRHRVTPLGCLERRRETLPRGRHRHVFVRHRGAGGRIGVQGSRSETAPSSTSCSSSAFSEHSAMVKPLVESAA